MIIKGFYAQVITKGLVCVYMMHNDLKVIISGDKYHIKAFKSDTNNPLHLGLEHPRSSKRIKLKRSIILV